MTFEQPAQPDDFPVGHHFGKYVVVEVAGRGAMGVVYRAREPALERFVALKVINRELATDVSFRERFAREARAAAALSHPSIVSVHQAGDVDGMLFIAMDWVNGGDLRHHVQKAGALPPRDAAGITGQVADALDVAHRAGVLHRDVKPANILLRQIAAGLHAYLTDFGIMRPFVTEGRIDDSLTQSGHIVGTPGFVSPEQIEGRPFDGRADIYALGCVLFESLTGRPPFQRETKVATLLAHTSAERPRVSATNPNAGSRFDEIVRKAMAIDPGDRFQTGREFADVLRSTAAKLALPPIRDVHREAPGAEGTPRRRTVISLDELPPLPVPQAFTTHGSQPTTTPEWAPVSPWVQPPVRYPGYQPRRSSSRARFNAVAVLLALALLLGALVALLLIDGGNGGPTPTDLAPPNVIVSE